MNSAPRADDVRVTTLVRCCWRQILADAVSAAGTGNSVAGLRGLAFRTEADERWGTVMTYLRARRSIKVAPGFKINLNKRSVGVSVGVRGAHYSVNSAGRKTKTVGIPGTGLSLVDSHGGHSASRRATAAPQTTRRRATAAVSSPTPKARLHAGLFASHNERAYAKALEHLRKGDMAGATPLLDEVIASDSSHESPRCAPDRRDRLLQGK